MKRFRSLSGTIFSAKKSWIILYSDLNHYNYRTLAKKSFPVGAFAVFHVIFSLKATKITGSCHFRIGHKLSKRFISFSSISYKKYIKAYGCRRYSWVSYEICLRNEWVPERMVVFSEFYPKIQILPSKPSVIEPEISAAGVYYNQCIILSRW